jgi:hypothetical protein
MKLSEKKIIIETDLFSVMWMLMTVFISGGASKEQAALALVNICIKNPDYVQETLIPDLLALNPLVAQMCSSLNRCCYEASKDEFGEFLEDVIKALGEPPPPAAGGPARPFGSSPSGRR